MNNLFKVIYCIILKKNHIFLEVCIYLYILTWRPFFITQHYINIAIYNVSTT